MLASGRRHVPIELGNWVVIPEQHFHFHLKVRIRSVCPCRSRFCRSFCAERSEPSPAATYTGKRVTTGSFVLFAVFLLGMIVSSLAGTIETLFFGWELVGLSSALLVAYFHERANPVRNGQSVWVIYRIADAAFLIAALTLHHLTGAGDFDRLMGTGAWPFGQASISESHALFVGLLLLVAAAGKSALVPFSGWLPRAMEGPTPSSAIFYGALSVHLGAFLLLRVSPLLEVSLFLEHCGDWCRIGVGDLRGIGRSRSNRHQECSRIRLAYSGGHHCCRDWLRTAVHRPRSHHRSRLPSDAATTSRTHATSRLSHTRKRRSADIWNMHPRSGRDCCRPVYARESIELQ